MCNLDNWTMSELLEPIRAGEYEVKQILRRDGYKVIDVSDNPRYWHKDIDLLVEGKEKVWSIEVKYDKQLHFTGNCFIEIANPRSKDGKGWFEFCEADWLFYGNGMTDTFYCMRLDELRAFIAENKDSLKLRSSHDDSRGYLLPLDVAPVAVVLEM